MALITYPLNNIEYTAEDAELFHSTRTSGVHTEDAFNFSVTGSNNIVTIEKGVGWIQNTEFSGKVIALKSSADVDLGIADSNLPRIDAIVLQFDSAKNATNIVVKNGTAQTNPAAPEITRTASVYELHLYHVLRNAGATVVSANDITDLRKDPAYCGLMLDSVSQLTVETLGAVPTTRTINGKDLSKDIALDAADVGAVPKTRTVNGKALSSNITLTAEDVGAVPKTRTVNGKALSSNITLTAEDVYALNAKKGTEIAKNSNLDDITEPGTYYVEQSAIAETITNLPYVSGASIIDVRGGGYSKNIAQVGYAFDNPKTPIFIRRKNDTSDSWGEWNHFLQSVNGVRVGTKGGKPDWGNVDITASDIQAINANRGVLIDEKTDIDRLRTPGTYYVNGDTLAKTLEHWPFDYSGVIDVRAGGYTANVIQIAYGTYSDYIPICTRQYDGSSWSKWKTFARCVNGVYPEDDDGNLKVTGNVYLTPEDINAVPKTRTVNSKALSSDITITAEDVSAVPKTRTVNGKALSSNISLYPSDFTIRTDVNYSFQTANVNTSSDGDTSCTLKYINFTYGCFVRACIQTARDFAVGNYYDIISVAESEKKPGYTTALATCSVENCTARISTDGMIQVRPYEKIASGKVIYISGYWFI